MEDSVVFEIKDRTAYVTLKRPKHNNAIDLGVRKGLSDAWKEIDANQEILSVILTGGEKVFSAGQDLVELTDFRKNEPIAELPLNNLETFGVGVTKPVIVAVSGHCLGAGFLLSMICGDIRVASESAYFGMPEVKVAVPPSFGIPAILCRHFPPAIATEILLFGNKIDSVAAHRMGFVNAVVPVDKMLSKAEEYASQINGMSPLMAKSIKQVLRKFIMPDQIGIDYCNAVCMLGRHSQDYAEGPRAFKEKRKPLWKGL
jgi:enoyl-CoA hydratase/carnithine racemase